MIPYGVKLGLGLGGRVTRPLPPGLGQRPKLDFHLMDFVFYSLDETQC